MRFSKLRDQRGQALVEMALVLPILVLIMFGIIEYGRIYNAQLQINSLARQAVRSAAVGTVADDTTLETNMESIIDGSTVVITRSGDDVTATVSYSVQLLTPLLIGSDSGTKELQAVVTMRDEGL